MFTLAEIYDFLDSMNTALLSADPSQLNEVAMRIGIMGPFVNSAGPDAQASYIAIKQFLVNNRTNLINPRTGQRVS